jgi:hypothetical protein
MKNSQANWEENSDANSQTNSEPMILRHGTVQHQFTDEERKRGGSSTSLAKSVSAQLRGVDINSNHIFRNYKQLRETGDVKALFAELEHTLLSLRKEVEDTNTDDSKEKYWKLVKYFEKTLEYSKFRFCDSPKEDVNKKTSLKEFNAMIREAKKKGQEIQNGEV